MASIGVPAPLVTCYIQAKSSTTPLSHLRNLIGWGWCRSRVVVYETCVFRLPSSVFRLPSSVFRPVFRLPSSPVRSRPL
eukprot:2209441-Prymnesium_polylepis.1